MPLSDHTPEFDPRLWVPVKVAAAAIIGVASDPMRVPPDVFNSPEPYRAAAHALGWGDWDGTPWWDAVMDEIG